MVFYHHDLYGKLDVAKRTSQRLTAHNVAPHAQQHPAEMLQQVMHLQHGNWNVAAGLV